MTGLALLIALAQMPAISLTQSDLITDFDSFIYLSNDSSLCVSETINIYFAQKDNHSMTRFIPLTIDFSGRQHHIYIKLNSVSCDGRPVPHEESIEGDNLKIKFGDSAHDVGQHKYALSYMARGAVEAVDGNPEVHWNVTGNDWPMTIERASAAFRLPGGLSISDLVGQSLVRNARQNSKPTPATPSEKALAFKANNLAPGQSMFVSVRLPKGAVNLPGSTNEFGWMVEEILQIGASLANAFLGWALLAIAIVISMISRIANRPRARVTSPPRQITSYRSGIK